MSLIVCNLAEHGGEILAIFNQAIRETTALYDYHPRTEGSMTTWFADKAAQGHPVLGWTEEGVLAGFSSYGPFRLRQAYKYTVEHSVYVVPRFHGRGIGRRLLQAIVAEAERNQLHTVVGCIDALNTPSIRLHESEGFEHCGTVRQAGFKFGRWLDASFYQKILKTPVQPMDG